MSCLSFLKLCGRRWCGLLLALAGAAGAAERESAAMISLRTAYAECAVEPDQARRLHCYDRLAGHFAAPSFEGRLSLTTPRFALRAGSAIRYQSDGAIFVMDLRDARGEVVQNLHLGGGGEARWVVAQSGDYQLDIHGSEGWRVWLEEPPPR